MEESINESITYQQEEITRMNAAIVGYKQSLDSLDIFKNNLQKLISKNDEDLKGINDKVSVINNSFKYNPRVYIVDNLLYPGGFGGDIDTVRFYFKDMETIHGEKLPKFDKIPFVVVQGYKIGINLLEVNKSSILVDAGLFYGDSKGNYPNNYRFNLWIGSIQ